MWRKSVVGIAVLNAAVAVLAFLKDLLLAAYAGTSVEADALTIAYFLPDSAGNNILAAALAVVCVPLFARLHARGEEARLRHAIRALTGWFTAMAALLTGLGFLFSAPIVHWFAASDGGQALAAHALPLLRILLPSLVLFTVIAIGTAVLQTFGRFLLPAGAPLVGHTAVVAVTALLLAKQVPAGDGIRWIALALTGGVLAMAAVIGAASFRAMRQAGGRVSRPEACHAADARRDLAGLLRLLGPYAIVLASAQTVHLAERYLLTQAETGAAAALNYAFRLSQLPVWIFVAAISAVMLPALTRHLAREEGDAARRMMNGAFHAAALIVLPLMLYLFALREPITIALFRRGAFDAHSAELTIGLLEGYALTIFGQAISFVGLRYFLARRTLAAAMLIHAATAGVTVLLDWALLPVFGVRAIGYAAAFGATLNALLIHALYRRASGAHAAKGGARAGHAKRYAQTLLPAVLLLFLFDRAWRWLAPDGAGAALGFVALTGSLFLAVYGLCAKRVWPPFFETLRDRREGG